MKLLGPPRAPEDAASRIGWFVRLRWLAAAGALVFPLAGRYLLRLRVAIAPFVTVAGAIVLYNMVFLVLGRKRWHGKGAGRFATIQVVTDLLVLTVLMHLGGGIENPFLLYYLFHTLIAAILLPGWRADLQVIFASMCVAALAAAEMTGLLPHRHVEGLWAVELYNDRTFVTVTVFAVVSTLSVVALLAGSIARRLREREEQLTEANAILAEQDMVKSQYVMRVAHDLAGPAGMITSCLKLITQGLTGPIPEKALDMVQRAQSRSEYLADLIRDLLSLSRIKAARKIPKTEVHLAEVVRQVLQDVQAHVMGKSLTLRQKLPQALSAVWANADAMHELFGNLLTNAVKYTPVGGHVEISAANAGSEVLVRVQDDGVGIPPEALPHIFEEFYRADNVKAEAVEGTGLGLSIVSQILRAHGGRIWVETQEGSGTTFCLALPAAGQAHAE